MRARLAFGIVTMRPAIRRRLLPMRLRSWAIRTVMADAMLQLELPPPPASRQQRRSAHRAAWRGPHR